MIELTNNSNYEHHQPKTENRCVLELQRVARARPSDLIRLLRLQNLKVRRDAARSTTTSSNTHRHFRFRFPIQFKLIIDL